MEDVARLITERYIGQDSDGNPTLKRYATEIFCKVGAVSRNEFYRAAEHDLHPDLVITISHKIDYNGEKLVMYNGKLYDVIRSYWAGDEVELTLTEKTGEELERYASLEMPDGCVLLLPGDYRLQLGY